MTNKSSALHVIFFLAAVSGNFVLLFLLKEITNVDWGYFNSLSLVIRSSVLNYSNFPIHDPWACGGLNLLENPQNRIFSPLILFDILFIPQLANNLSLLLYGYAGLWGMYKLLRQFEVSSKVAVVSSIFFINSTWFGLHFAEGHIPYGSMQLLPWVVYTVLTFEKKTSQVLFFSLLSLFLLDGGMYTFIFSLFTIISLYAARIVKVSNTVRDITNSFSFLLTLLLAFLLITLPKTLPSLMGSSYFKPHLDYLSMPFVLVLKSFFSPTQQIAWEGVKVAIGSLRFHEFGCYLGLCFLFCVSKAILSGGFLRNNLNLLLLIVFWFWVGSGWIESINPWRFYLQIPIISQAHVQSRVFIIMFLFYMIFASKALDKFLLEGNVRGTFILFIVIESIVVRNFPFLVYYYYHNDHYVTESLITHTKIEQTEEAIFKPDLYLKKNTATYLCYEPAVTNRAIGNVEHIDSNDYQGEVFVENDKGQASYLRYTPGEIELHYNVTPPARIVLNTSELGAWNIVSGEGNIVSDSTGLLKIDVNDLSGNIKLSFLPWYFYYIIVSYTLGLLLFVICWMRTNRFKNDTI